MGSSWAASVYLGDKSILRMRTRVSEGHLTSCHRGGRLELCAGPAPLLSLGCHSEKSSSPATREILFAGCWLAAGCRRRAESRKFKASVRAGLDGVAGRAGAAVPRQAAGSCTANRVRRPRTRSRAERSPVSRSEPGHGCGHGHWRCRGSVLHC